MRVDCNRDSMCARIGLFTLKPLYIGETKKLTCTWYKDNNGRKLSLKYFCMMCYRFRIISEIRCNNEFLSRETKTPLQADYVSLWTRPRYTMCRAVKLVAAIPLHAMFSWCLKWLYQQREPVSNMFIPFLTGQLHVHSFIDWSVTCSFLY